MYFDVCIQTICIVWACNIYEFNFGAGVVGVSSHKKNPESWPPLSAERELCIFMTYSLVVLSIQQ